MKQLLNVSADSIANIYFDGKVISHSVHFPDGSKKTLGVIFPGTYHFGTAAPELMEITDGTCEIKIDDTDETRLVSSDESFEVAGNSGFTITVHTGICQYICSFLTH